jgi:hypothetical protein
VDAVLVDERLVGEFGALLRARQQGDTDDGHGPLKVRRDREQVRDRLTLLVPDPYVTVDVDTVLFADFSAPVGQVTANQGEATAQQQENVRTGQLAR